MKFSDVLLKLRSFLNPSYLLIKFSIIDNDDGSIRVKIHLRDENKYISYLERNYKKNYYQYGLPLNALDEVVICNNNDYSILGWDENNLKYPLLIKRNIDGHLLKMTPDYFTSWYHSNLKEIR